MMGLVHVPKKLDLQIVIRGNGVEFDFSKKQDSRCKNKPSFCCNDCMVQFVLNLKLDLQRGIKGYGLWNLKIWFLKDSYRSGIAVEI